MNLLTVADVAERLQLSRSQVYAMKEKINYVKLGGAVRFRPEDVDCYVREHLFGDRKCNNRQLKHIEI